MKIILERGEVIGQETYQAAIIKWEWLATYWIW